jgi:hypothetical protein
LFSKNGSGILLEKPTKARKPRTPDQGLKTHSSTTQQILRWIDETFEVIVYPSGFEDCIVGVGERFGGPPMAVLDVEKMFTKMEREGMTREEAIEYFEFNILGAHVGEQNPVYMHIPNFKVEKEPARRKRKEKK